jgi:hypothetical protein
MRSDFEYSPIIKGKLNDIKAVSFTAPEVAARLKPVFELPPFIETDKPEQILGRFATRLNKFYGTRPCYVDFPLLKPGTVTSDGQDALLTAYRQLDALGVEYEPVYGFDREHAYWPTILAQAKLRNGLLLRLEAEDVEFVQDTLDLIQDLTLRGLDTRQMDVLLDFRYLGDSIAAGHAAAQSALFIEQLSTSFNVRRLIVAGSSAPKTVVAVPKNDCGDVARHELALWAGVRSRRLALDAVYGDYGVIHPDFTDLTPSPHINGKIRYTHGRYFRIFRGHSLRQGEGYEQYRTLSHAVLQSGYFQGHTYSRGDRYVYDCASGQATTGNPGTWVLNDLNHHYTYAVKQVQRLEPLIYRGYPEEAVLQQA